VVKIANEPPTEEVIELKKKGYDNAKVVSELAKKGFNNQQISEALNQADIKGGVEGKIPAAAEENFSEAEMKPSALSDEEMAENIPVPSPPKNAPGPAAAPDATPNEESPAAIGLPATNIPDIPEAQDTFSQPLMPPGQPTATMDMESIQELVESVIDERWQEVVVSVGDITIWKSRVEDDISAIKQEVLRLEDRFTKLQSSIIGKVDEYQRGIAKVGNEMEALEKVFSKIMEPLTTNIKELQRITKDMKDVKK